MTTVRLNHHHTIRASCIGYITQATINNFAPLLFLTFASEFALPLSQITLLTTVNFIVQLTVDYFAARYVDRIGYRPCIVAAHFFCAAGLIGLALFPSIFPTGLSGLIAAIVLYAIGGGLTEVLISPIVEACPTDDKAGSMSFLHSIYCWGHVGLVLVCTAYFSVFGTGSWRILAMALALIPLANAFYFMKVPIYPIVPDESQQMTLGDLLRQKAFWLLLAVMVCAGASEQAVSQWASAFAEDGLKLSKTLGDLTGPCAFAVMMGLSRMLYARFSQKLPLKAALIGSGVMCIACYLLIVFAPSPLLALIGCALCGFSVGMFWPGTFSVAALALPGGGTAMYGLMALAGDLGCSAGPTVVGVVADAAQGSLTTGIAASIVFPVLIVAGYLLVRTHRR